MKRILVVCMGNICRSPTGEAVLRAKAEELGVDVDIDSAGTIGYHTGNTPDSRAMAAGKQRGYSFKGMRARQVSLQDFEDFDLVLAADKANLADLLDICPAEHRHKVSLFLSHSNSSYDEIPDPYYGGDDGFELVLDLIEEASVAVLQKL
ncbi:TPA: low molecular weight phosphotyrosine protein phosphatase [Vibrio parahaemolyticus]|uniref:low molecular weight protein-tyrosine-phosphatase n=1 Tax=Vibrio parahaemolyticus TaxID=670 RepID=UPI0010DA92B6|nr:low molecular weight protein-tyrosine-phosphatase [Vibrio parahaemolyticus]EGQ8957773.1 low molecular weight phosphotyrosine protein phosphatase [Vibrio parahaemolyticus]EGR0689411.1 low molecular weight phosphotyrosine protein phosphatase [Vibrio parahaemolyticus]EGR0926651.1 low molecular weight phosphotyrosine protein phosphatase [Vibrio parahaemolyticus]EGR3232769.1 low molecular weight phosphotyrosine protein phosphatase [Vibrio parahaemolyticus]EHJ9977516.1 low molecular weight phosph